MMSECLYAKGSVIWYELPGPGVYKKVWWPCKVVSTEEGIVTFESFNDQIRYEKCPSSDKVKPFNYAGSDILLTTTKKKLQKKKDTLKIFMSAVTEALDYYRETEDDPTFSLTLDSEISPNNSSAFTNSSMTTLSSITTPNQTLFNNSIFTTSTDSGLTPPLTRRSRKRQRSDYPDDTLGMFRSVSPHRKAEHRKMDNIEVTVATKLNFDHKPAEIKRRCKRRGDRRSSTPLTEARPKPDTLLPMSTTEVKLLAIKSPETVKSPTNKSASPQMSRTLSSVEITKVPPATKPMAEDAKARLSPMSASTVGMTSVREDSESEQKVDIARPLPGTVGVMEETISSSPLPSENSAALDNTPAESSQSDSFLQPGYETMLQMMQECPSQTEPQVTGSDSDDSNDDMPTVDFSVNENVRLHQLKPNKLLWVKYDKYPYWPAVVMSISNRKRPSRCSIQIRFLGYSSSDPSIKIRNSKKVALYGTKRAKEFKEVGFNCSFSKEFGEAVEDADRLTRMRAEGEIRGDPMEQLEQNIKYRPISSNKEIVESPMARISQTPVKVGVVDEKATPILRDSDSDSEEVHISSSEGEEDNEQFQYNRSKVMAILKSVESYLVDIVRGKVSSRRHTAFVSGSEKERNALKKEGIYGPLMKWTSSTRFNLVQDIKEMVSRAEHQLVEVKLSQEYLLDVLVPEAIIKVIMLTEGLLYREAESKL